MGTTALAEEDWADNWKNIMRPARITHDLTIVPSWTDYEGWANWGEKDYQESGFWDRNTSDDQDEPFALEQVLRGVKRC